ncbi:LCP family protein [Saccharomonospora sp.]|uniref:LCP family protein n=1 Tax=Saccharomonospora sp. TaxID=33913 RepID=UPI00261B482E|nr:LCP family protein [Saccharomonospora sp.]
MTDDRTEALLREALEYEANRAVDPGVVQARLNNRPTESARRRGPALIGVAVAVAVVVLTAVVVIPRLLGQDAPDERLAAATDGSAPVTVLVAGMDDHGYTDSILLTRVHSDGVSVVSLPRNIWTNVPGHGEQQLNSAYRYGREAALADGKDAEAADRAGAQTLVSTVADLTGTTIDHYALVDTDVIGAVTKTVGGVEVCVNTPVDDPGTEQRRKLSGDDAVTFLEQRRDLPDGDLDRVVRLQAFTRSLFDSVTQSGEQLKEVADVVAGHVRTDAELDILGLAERLAGMERPSLSVATIPLSDDEAKLPDGRAVIDIDTEQVRAFTPPFLDGETPDGDRPDHSLPDGELPCVN